MTFVPLVTCVLSSCREDTGNSFVIRSSVARPVLDHSTPDRLVKSAWAYASWEGTLLNDSILIPPFLSDRARKALIASLANQNDENAKEIGKYEILKVNSESESRSTLLAWEGKDTILYTLSNPGTGWLVEDRQQKCLTCLGTGKETDYDAWKKDRSSTFIPKKECSRCQGRGMISSYYRSK